MSFSFVNTGIFNIFYSLRPATAKPVENVILDQLQQSDEEEETFIVVENEASENLVTEVTISL